MDTDDSRTVVDTLPVSTGFSSIHAPDLVGLIEAQLQRAILEGRMPPGTRIVEAELARQMGVSRAPVREAARRLESIGLVVSRPRHGFAVRTMSPKQIEDLYAVRINLELMAAALACERASDAELAELNARVEQMIVRADTLSRGERTTLDLDLHADIARLSGNEYLHRLFCNMRNEVQMLLALSEDTYGDDPQYLATTHLPIVRALARRDVAGVQAAMRHHLEVAGEHARNFASTK